MSVADYKSSENEKFVGILDSGSSVIHAEKHAHDAFFKKIDAQFDEKLRLFTIPCNKLDSLPSWLFKIGGVEYEVKPDEYLLEVLNKKNLCKII